MKKLVSIIMAVLMVCMLVPAMAEETVTGIWYLVEAAGLNPAAIGMSMTITLNEDGTGVVSQPAGDKEASWKLDGSTLTLTMDGEDENFEVSDGTLKTTLLDGTPLTFGREEAAVVIPQAVAAESEEDFFGTWVVSTIGMNGALLPMNAVPEKFAIFNMAAVIEAGKASVAASLEDMENCKEFTTELQEGKLVMSRPGDNGGDPVIRMLESTDQGKLLMSINLNGTPIALYLDKVEPAE